jgi:DNA-binding CsgD family transcriptional regulator
MRTPRLTFRRTTGRTAEAVGGRLVVMALGHPADRRPLAGRATELRALADLVHGAGRGRAGTLLISGEAGVGKTALVRQACASADDAAVLWAACLPLTSLAVPFLPLTSALRGWTRPDGPVPVLDVAGGGGTGGGPVEVDAWLDRACRLGPVILVADDLQWADQSSLDVLMYVVAGPADRRLAVVVTVRTGEVGPAHRLRRWLADVRRLPRVAELRLDRLDRQATEQQLTDLLGDPPHRSLIDDVFARTRGNAYLTMLLARGLPPDATEVPPGLPGDLREAVARAWLELSAVGQNLTRLLAVAGGPQHARTLGDVAAHVGAGGDVVPLLREALDRGVLELTDGERYWFVHPLLAEVLEEGLLPEERVAGHAAFAELLEPEPDARGDVGVERAVDLADHHYRAGHVEQAYRWALLSARAAEQAGGSAESVRLLRRALDLWPRVPGGKAGREELLQRIRASAEQAGQQPDELAAVEDLLALVDAGRHPLLAAELLVRRMLLRHSTGRKFADLSDVRTAVGYTAQFPDSKEHALAMAELAHAELWHGQPSGPGRARQAVGLARACRSPRALAYALTAQAMSHCRAGEGGGAAAAQEAQAAAVEARDFWAFVHATAWWVNSLDSVVSPVVLDHLRRSRAQLVSLGAPHAYVAHLCAAEAAGLLMRGDWRACLQRLRVTLGSDPGPMPAVDARLTAALLACWQGRPAEARAHLRRGDELFAETAAYGPVHFQVARVELAVATSDTEAAVNAALLGVQGPMTPTMVERLIPLAARALADQVQQLTDRGVDIGPTVDRIDELRRGFPRVITEPGSGPQYQAEMRAMQAWYDAEVFRGRRDPQAGAAWQRAGQACRTAELAWDEAYAHWRAAEALLPDRVAREPAVASLRRAHQLAGDLQAAPLLNQVAMLARSARVQTASPVRVPVDDAMLAGLTTREREILSYVAAGSTYREIARALVVSEKTVSVHISNMLRKTGAANRIELAQLAHRLTRSPPDP